MKTASWHIEPNHTFKTVRLWAAWLGAVIRCAIGRLGMKRREQRREQLSREEHKRRILIALHRRLRDWDGNE